MCPEDYIDYEKGPLNYEFRVPLLNCGAVSKHRDFVYTRILKSEGKEAMDSAAVQAVHEFEPDIVVFAAPCHLNEGPSLKTFSKIMSYGIPIFTHIPDSYADRPDEIGWLMHCNYLGIADSSTNAKKLESLITENHDVRGVILTSGQLVVTDYFFPSLAKKIYDVTLLGSKEGLRNQLGKYLENELANHGITLFKTGGFIDDDKRITGDTSDLTGAWVPIEEYVSIINRSKICISSQTRTERPSVKGKIFQYLACCTLCITDSNALIKRIIPDDCVVYYDSFEDCLEKVLYYHFHPEEAEVVARRGYSWFNKIFNYKKFWKTFLESAVRGDRMPIIQLDKLKEPHPFLQSDCVKTIPWDITPPRRLNYNDITLYFHEITRFLTAKDISSAIALAGRMRNLMKNGNMFPDAMKDVDVVERALIGLQA